MVAAFFTTFSHLVFAVKGQCPMTWTLWIYTFFVQNSHSHYMMSENIFFSQWSWQDDDPIKIKPSILPFLVKLSIQQFHMKIKVRLHKSTFFLCERTLTKKQFRTKEIFFLVLFAQQLSCLPMIIIRIFQSICFWFSIDNTCYLVLLMIDWWLIYDYL